MPDVWLRYIRVCRSDRPIAESSPADRLPPTDLGRSPAYAVVGSGRENRQATARSIDRRTLETPHGAGRDQRHRVVAAANFDVLVRPCRALSGMVGQSLKPPATAARKRRRSNDSKRLTTKCRRPPYAAKE